MICSVSPSRHDLLIQSGGDCFCICSPRGASYPCPVAASLVVVFCMGIKAASHVRLAALHASCIVQTSAPWGLGQLSRCTSCWCTLRLAHTLKAKILISKVWPEERRYDVISILQTVKAGSNVAMHASFTNVPFSGHSLPGPHLC